MIISIDKKERKVKGESKIYFETCVKLKRFAAGNPEKLEELTEEELKERINGKGEVKRNDGIDYSGSFSLFNGTLHI